MFPFLTVNTGEEETEEEINFRSRKLWFQEA